jgi:hypothetical protein
MLSLNLRLSDYMSKEPLLEGGPRTIETQVRSIAATFQRELDSAVSSNKPLVRMLALDKQRQRLAAQIPSLQAQLQEMKKDEFETTQQFEERRRPLQERLAQVQKELPSIEEALGAADTSAELRKVAASIVIPVRIYLPTESPTYDADRREIRCKVPPVKDNCECERREGSRRIDNVDRVIYTKCVLTLMFNSKAGGELLFQNIPDIQTAKKLKDCLELDNLFTLEKNTAWRKASGAVVDGLANVSYSCTVSDSTNLLRIQEPYLRTTELRCVIDFRKSVSVAMPDLSDDLSKLHISVEYLPGRK